MDKTLIKGLRVLETLATYDEPVSLGEIAEACHLPKSNAHRVLATFLEMGYVVQEPRTRRYKLTLRVWSLGARAVERLDFKREAQPFLAELNRLTGETTHLSVFDDGDVIYIDKLEAVHAVRTFTRIGGRAPAVSVATGQAMLAFQSTAVIEQAMDKITVFTNETETDPNRLRTILDTVRANAFAVNRGGWRGGAYGLAAPVFGADNATTTAIGISAPKDRMPETRIAELEAPIKNIAQRLSAALGASNLHVFDASADRTRSRAF